MGSAVAAPEVALAGGVGGTVAPGFEPVAAQLSRLIAEGEERGCAAAAYLDGKPVVDIWAGQAGDGPWQEDTLGLTYSVTKGPSALCVQMLHDRGELDVDAPVARYWPEYGAAGKDSTRVKDVLNHTAAQFTFPDYWRDIGPDYEAIADQELMARRLAESPPAWEPGTRPMYHAVTYGHLVGEIVRRVTGRSLGRLFREELAEPLGLDYWIGLPRERLGQVARPVADAVPPGRRGRHRRRFVEAGRAALLEKGAFEPAAWPFALLLAHPDLEDPVDLSFLGKNDWGYTGELGASNGTGTARALARLFAMLAEGGELDGRRYVSRESIRRFTDPTEGRGGGFALGFGPVPAFLRPIGIGPHAFASAGAGGSLVLADPDNRVSLAFTKNQMRDSPLSGIRLLLAFYRCLGRGGRVARALASGLLNNRSLTRGLVNGPLWLATFRAPPNEYPMG